jgi:hypothetical protein
MPNFTSPDNIQYPVGTDPVAPLANVFQDLATTTQTAVTAVNTRVTNVDNELNATKILALDDVPDVDAPNPLAGTSLIFDGGFWVAEFPLLLETSQQTNDYTLALSDAGKVVPVNGSSTVTITVPGNSSVAFPVGTVINIYNASENLVVISGEAGVTVRNAGTMAVQYSEISLRKRATNEWVLAGSLL